MTNKNIYQILIFGCCLALFCIQGCALMQTTLEYNESLEAFKGEKYDVAMGYISAVIEKNPSDRTYRSLLGWIHFKQGRMDEAERIFLDIYLERSDEISAIQGLAWVACMQRRFEVAEKGFRTALAWVERHTDDLYWARYKIDDKNYILSVKSDACYGLGLCAFSQGEYARAKTFLSRALKHRNHFTGHSPIKTALADLLYYGGNYREAAAYYQDALSDKSDENTLLKLGWCFQLAGESRGSENVFRQGLKRAEDRRPFLHGLVFATQAQSNVQGSLQHLSELIRLDPYYADTADLKAVAQKMPGWEQVCLDWAASYFDRGDFSRTTGKLDARTAPSPDDSQILLMKAWCRIYIGQPETALRRFSALGDNKSIAPDKVETGKAVALLYLRRLDEADKAFWRACELNPKNARAKLGRGAVAYLRGYYQEAINIYTYYPNLLPEREAFFSWGSHALNNLGWSYIKTCQYRKAFETFSRLAQYHPDPYIRWFSPDLAGAIYI